MATNILSIPFRRTKPVPLIETLKSFISTTLDQHPEQFKDGLLALDRLRADIITLDIHPSSLERLLKYHGQLIALSSKLPIDVSLCATCLTKDRGRIPVVSVVESCRPYSE